MATNFYFNNFQSSQEQLLIENLVIESIKIYGHDVFYLPRKRENFDKLYTEDAISSFNVSYMVEMYIKNVDGFSGEGDFLSKFNLQIRDSITFCLARRVFNDEIGNIEALVRPQEGDLIFFPLNNKIFEIKFVEHEAIFYQLGSLQMYELRCELFEYSNEVFNTGIPDLDNLYTNGYSLDLTVQHLLYELAGSSDAILNEDGSILLLEDADIGEKIIYDNNQLQSEALTFIDFTELDPFSEGHI